MDIDDRGYQGELVEWHLCEDRFMGWGTAYREKLRIISGTPMLKLESESGVRLVFDGVDIKAHWPDRDRYNNLTMVRGRGTLTEARKQWETTRDDSVRKMCKDVFDTPLVKDKGANGN
ncbi:MAG: hypothetical protein GXP29_05275 [Planctomycetes bacterium]|nr:hypothetical protein [Planctomycetota bacterium]